MRRTLGVVFVIKRRHLPATQRCSYRRHADVAAAIGGLAGGSAAVEGHVRSKITTLAIKLNRANVRVMITAAVTSSMRLPTFMWISWFTRICASCGPCPPTRAPHNGSCFRTKLAPTGSEGHALSVRTIYGSKRCLSERGANLFPASLETAVPLKTDCGTFGLAVAALGILFKLDS